MFNKTVLITGITGQLGSFMAEKCLEDGDFVIGLVRRSSAPNLWRIDGIKNHKNLMLVEGDGVDPLCINNLISRYKPTIVYNYMAQSHVFTSFQQPSYTAEITGRSVLYLLEAIRQCSPHTILVHASTSEQFGDQYDVDENGIKYQDESTKMNIQSPYGNAKLEAYNYVRLYRQSYGLFATNIIMFNAESSRRAENFVTRKISLYVAKLNKAIKDGVVIDKLKLGNIHSYRDWGAVQDYISAYQMAAKHSNPDDFVICTADTHSIKDFLTESFGLIGIQDWTPYVEIDETLKRPSEVDYLRGKYDKAKRILGWEPKVKFKELVKQMVEADIRRLS